MDIETLVKSVKDGDRAAIGELVERFQRVAIARAWSILGDYHLAQDTAQDAFVIAVQKIDSLKNPIAFSSWFFEILRRESIRKHKQVQRLIPVDHNVDTRWTNSPAVESADRFEQQQEILSAVRLLPQHEQDVVVLHYLDGNTAQQVAAILDRPLGTVTKQLSRAVKRLRSMLEVPNESK